MNLVGRESLSQLTERQRAIYDFIRNYIRLDGKPPTIRMIQEAMELKSVNGVMSHLRALEKKGVMIRDRRSSRGIRLLVEEPPSVTLKDGRLRLDCGAQVRSLTQEEGRRLARQILRLCREDEDETTE